MKIIADLQIHSKYSRACSQDLIPTNIVAWADKKGIGIIGTGDLTHPLWLKQLKEDLTEDKPGLYRLKDKSVKACFMLTGEISSIYKLGDKVRRIHNMILSPSFEATDKLISGLEKAGANLKSDGRPITGIKCDQLVKIAKEADERIEIIPAHVWTPHFGLFGSLSGFDAVEEAFGEYSKYIFALETGLSSDPKMNWQISKNDKYTLLSNSDAHSLRKIGREANAFEMVEDKMSYDEVIRIIKEKNPKEFLYTIEFFPEEGKYHLDGHADCKFSCLPTETAKLKGLCPKCGKKLLVGVLNRIDHLGDREFGFIPEGSVPFKNTIPLEEIIAETYDVGTGSKKVLQAYENIVSKVNEFEVLLDLSEEEIKNVSDERIAKSVIRVRNGNVHIEAGYDGIFGKIHIYEGQPNEKYIQIGQNSLF